MNFQKNLTWDDFVDSNDEELTVFLEQCIESAKSIIVGSKGNRYDPIIKDLASFLYIRCGRKAYEFLALNLKFPTVNAVLEYMDKSIEKMIEGVMYYDRLKDFLLCNDYNMDVGVFEDATRIKKYVDFDLKNNCLMGLSAPIDQNGLPKINAFPARSDLEIYDAIVNNEMVGYVQAVIVQTNTSNAPPFFLGFYGTNNKFNASDIVNQVNEIKKELKSREINMICFGTDGDQKFLSAEKTLIKYGEVFTEFASMTLPADLKSEIHISQDGLHIEKKLKTCLYDFCNILLMGDYVATSNHLIIMYQKYHKHQHGLLASDLDPKDHLNYQCIPKITDEKVLKILDGIKEAAGTKVFLELIRSVHLAFVEKDTKQEDRIFHGAFCVGLIRTWRQWLLENNLPVKGHFITQNAWDGIEMNFTLLINLVCQGKAANFGELNSQLLEEFFRTFRSFTPVESTVINVGMKEFASRNSKINHADTLKKKLQAQNILFPTKNKSTKIREEALNESEIALIIKRAFELVNEKCNQLNMLTENELDVKKFLKSPKNNFRGGVVANTMEVDIEQEEFDENETSSESSCTDSETNEECEIIEISDDEEILTENEQIMLFKDFELTGMTSNDSFLTVKQHNSLKVIRKSQFIHMLINDKDIVSSDVRFRYIPKKNMEFKDKSSDIIAPLSQKDEISKGDYILMKADSDSSLSYWFGQVLNFEVANKTTKKAKVYYGHASPVQNQSIKLLLHPLYEITSDFIKTPSKIIKYHKISDYVCHVEENSNFSSRNVKNYIKNC